MQRASQNTPPQMPETSLGSERSAHFPLPTAETYRRPEIDQPFPSDKSEVPTEVVASQSMPNRKLYAVSERDVASMISQAGDNIILMRSYASDQGDQNAA